MSKHIEYLKKMAAEHTKRGDELMAEYNREKRHMLVAPLYIKREAEQQYRIAAAYEMEASGVTA